VSKLPVVSGKKAVKALSKAGFYIHHQKGSHIVLKKEGYPCALNLTSPLHEIITESGNPNERHFFGAY